MLEESFELLLPPAAGFAGAAEYLEVPKTSMRERNTLRLLIAADRGARKILTLDAGFIEAGKQLKLPVARGIRA